MRHARHRVGATLAARSRSSWDKSGTSARATDSRTTGTTGSARSGARASSQDPIPVRVEARAQRGIVRFCRCRACVDHDVDRGQVSLAMPKRLPHDPLQPITRDGVARRLDADRHAQPSSNRRARTGDDEEQRVGGSLAVPMHGVEAGFVGDAARAREASRGVGRTSGGSGGQTARRLRPFARRRLSTSRPPFVAMRARKPWTRLRCRLLGW